MTAMKDSNAPTKLTYGVETVLYSTWSDCTVFSSFKEFELESEAIEEFNALDLESLARAEHNASKLVGYAYEASYGLYFHNNDGSKDYIPRKYKNFYFKDLSDVEEIN